jgi:hypothetical protein
VLPTGKNFVRKAEKWQHTILCGRKNLEPEFFFSSDFLKGPKRANPFFQINSSYESQDVCAILQ